MLPATLTVEPSLQPSFQRFVTTDKLPVGILRVPSLAPLLVANFSAFVVDYIARQKMGGTMKFHVLKQLPVLPPEPL